LIDWGKMDDKPKELKNQLDLAVQTFTESFMDISKQIQERLRIVEEKEKKWLEMEEKIKHNASQAKNKIKLDIGGKIFATSKSTLLSIEGSYFHTLLSSGHWQPDEDGTYFVDRNPQFFDVILDYIRTGKIDLTDLNHKELTKLKEDLDYFQIQLPSPIQTISSDILDINMESSLLAMLPPGIQQFRLVHDSSKGISANDFDRAVKGVGPTLIIIKSTTNYVFGAYVHDTWGQPDGWIEGSKETFLFTFGNNSSQVPVKLLHNGGNGIYISRCGMHLGTDLVAFCTTHACSPQVYTKVAPGYNAVVDNKLLAGAPGYTPLQMEVFAVSKI